MLRVAIVAVGISVVCLAAKAEDAEPEKISNDRPDRPLHLPAASSETKEAFDDFDRFARRGAWERATKALYTIAEDQAGRFVDGKDGFIISVARKRRAVLEGLSPEGQAAYRLFYDSDAKKLFDEAEGPTEQATLERLYSSYFLTSVGDNAADRLGDLYFERGEYDRAADCWLSILRERPDSEIPPALLTVKAALALARAGRRSELEAIRADLADRYADEVVTLGGRKAKAAEYLKKIRIEADPAGSSASSGGPAPALPETVAPAWQVRFGASVTAGMTPEEVVQWEKSALSGAAPVVTVEGKRLYANYLGYIFAVDLTTGKMLWRSASFHNLEQTAMQGQTVDPQRFAIVADSGYVWTLGRDTKDQNYGAVSHLVCRRAETGEVVWQSTDLPEYSGMDLMGVPILERGTLYVAGKKSSSESSNSSFSYYGDSGTPHQYVLAIRPHDGKPVWKTDVGTFREGSRYYYYGQRDDTPQPRLIHRAGSIYIDTHQGILARLDAESGVVDWGFGYPTDPVQNGGGRFIIFFNGEPYQNSTTSVSSTPIRSGDALLVKGAKSDRLCAIDPDRMTLLWDRPISKSARMLGVDDEVLYLGGPELGALDLKTRALRWSTPLPGGSDYGRVLVRLDGIWQLTPRGIFEIDPKSGSVRRIFRGGDSGSSGGDLVLTDTLLLAITNQTISAYPRGTNAVAASGTQTKGIE